jgi:hypothetical protein
MRYREVRRNRAVKQWPLRKVFLKERMIGGIIPLIRGNAWHWGRGEGLNN